MFDGTKLVSIYHLDCVGVTFNAPVCLLLYIVSKILCNANKTVLGKGDTLRFPQLAETLEIVAQKGADAFYTGKIGQDLVKDIQEAGLDNLHIVVCLKVKTDKRFLSPACFFL